MINDALYYLYKHTYPGKSVIDLFLY